MGLLGTEDGAEIELRIAPGGKARWRQPGRLWVEGEWDRASRLITFVWPDETEWRAQYDPMGNALLLEETVAGSESTILRKTYR